MTNTPTPLNSEEELEKIILAFSQEHVANSGDSLLDKYAYTRQGLHLMSEEIAKLIATQCVEALESVLDEWVTSELNCQDVLKNRIAELEQRGYEKAKREYEAGGSQADNRIKPFSKSMLHNDAFGVMHKVNEVIAAVNDLRAADLSQDNGTNTSPSSPTTPLKASKTKEQ